MILLNNQTPPLVHIIIVILSIYIDKYKINGLIYDQIVKYCELNEPERIDGDPI